jgi:nucleotide-binding universal stress UspA family protein
MSIANVLVPVQLDARDERVIRYACGLESQSVRRLLIAHVVESSGMEYPVLAAEVDRARDRLAEMAEPLRSCSMEVEIRVVTGDVRGALIALAHQTNVNVICCGTEGKSLVDYIFSGSVSEDLVNTGTDRTMTVRYDLLESVEDPASLARAFAHRLVIPTDFSAAGTRAFLSAFDRPAEALGELHLLHVVHDADGATDRKNAEVKLRGMLEIAKDHDVEAHYEIREGDPGEVTLAYLDEANATGVITGRHGRGRMRQAVLGSVSLSILREARCPVVIQP